MRVLYNEVETKRQEYRYTINSGGELRLEVSNGSERHVTITFVNDKFYEVTHNIDGSFEGTRSYWHVMQAINEMIKDIEARINAPKSEL